MQPICESIEYSGALAVGRASDFFSCQSRVWTQSKAPVVSFSKKI